MKKKKIILLIVLVIMLFGVIHLQNTLAKYRKQVEVPTDFHLASWNIRINQESILNKTEMSSSIIPVLDSNEYVKTGVIAPGSSGYFDIKIDASDVDVSFRYHITSTISEESSVSDIIIKGYDIDTSGDGNNFSNTITSYDENGITGEIIHNTAGCIVRIYIEWNDNDATQTMDNQKDTLAASTLNGKAIMKPVVTFTQIQ